MNLLHEADNDAVIRLESTATAAFAHSHRQTPRKQLQPAARALRHTCTCASFKASSALVQRVFSQGDTVKDDCQTHCSPN